MSRPIELLINEQDKLDAEINVAEAALLDLRHQRAEVGAILDLIHDAELTTTILPLEVGHVAPQRVIKIERRQFEPRP